MTTTTTTTSLLVSGEWIAEIYRCENLIVELVNHVAETLNTLGAELNASDHLNSASMMLMEEKEHNEDTKLEVIATSMEQYFTKLDEIQAILRKHFRLLTVEGISTVLPPFRANLYKEERLYVDLIQGLQFVVQKIDQMHYLIESKKQ